MGKTRVFIVDDHAIFRDGLKLLFSTIKDVEIVGEATNGRSFIENIASPLPDIVFMDINMKEMDGIETTQKALEKFPEIKIVALTSFEDEEYFNKMTDLGVRGYLLKNSAKEDFERAITRVMEGYYYYSDELVVKLTRKMAQMEKLKFGKQDELVFSAEEKMLLQYICQGFTNKQIADLVHLSSRTIESHRAKLLDKTDTKNSVALAVYAIANKIIKPTANS
jgi:DNA-binding NarL/FixJ family response regulator